MDAFMKESNTDGISNMEDEISENLLADEDMTLDDD